MRSHVFSAVTALFLLAIASSTDYCVAQEVIPADNPVANFRFGNRSYGVFSEAANQLQRPALWQFRYHPLFLPQRAADGGLKVILTEADGSFNLSIPLQLGAAQPNKLAFESLVAAYPEYREQLKAGNFRSLYLNQLSFRFEPHVPVDLGSLLTNPLNPHTTEVVSVVLISPSKESRNKLIKWLTSGITTLYCDYEYSTRNTSQNAAQLKFSDLQHTKLQAALNGVPHSEGDPVYVKRNDLRKLSENLHTEVSIAAVIQDPARFDVTIIDSILAKWNQTRPIELSKISTDTIAKSTYNPKDLEPDTITHQVNDWFQKNAGTNEYTVNKSELVKAGMSLGPFGGSGEVSTTFNEATVQKYLDDNGYHCDLTGAQIKPKSVDVQQVNLYDFGSNEVLTQAYVYEGPVITHKDTFSVQLEIAVADDPAVLLDLSGQIDQLGRTEANDIAKLTLRIAKLEKDLEEARDGLKQQIASVSKTEAAEIANTVSTFSDNFNKINQRVTPIEDNVNKIVNGWFMIESPLIGHRSPYFLDVTNGIVSGHDSPDGSPTIKLEATTGHSQRNRMFRLHLLKPGE